MVDYGEQRASNSSGDRSTYLQHSVSGRSAPSDELFRLCYDKAQDLMKHIILVFEEKDLKPNFMFICRESLAQQVSTEADHHD